MRIGIFGGSFDPVHLGHLVMAEQCREQGRLDQLWFMPASVPPHKQNRQLASFAQRVEMLTLALSGQPAFHIKELENERSGPSYTVDTLSQIRKTHPDDDIYLIIGADTLLDFPNWRQPQRIVELVALLVADRPGWDMPDVQEVRSRLSLSKGVDLRVEVIQMPLINLSSTDIRQRSHDGRSVRYLVPRAVEVYMAEKGLYG